LSIITSILVLTVIPKNPTILLLMTDTSRYFRIISKYLIILFSVTLSLAAIFSVLFSDWSLRNGDIHLSYKIILACCVCGIIVLGVSLTNFWGLIKLTISICAILMTFVFSTFFLNPIDTTTEPYDKAILERFPNGNKIVIRQYMNAKTNRKISDTVLVKDTFIFRKIFRQKK
jgi:hypothetical protein